uniref:DDB1 and CUL4 associated factor 17 n=1 Tax=Otolemur garnettii TaxID=30611 RepID=H0XM93_OTOGA
ESTKFTNVWTMHSKSPVAYRIYFDNYPCCVSRVASEPRKLYEMPKCSKSEKIEGTLLWECPVYLSWDTIQEIIVVKSALNKGPAVARQADFQQPILVYLSFQVLLFSFVGILEFNKKDFGMSYGILIVMDSSGLVRFYSFQAITKQSVQQNLNLGYACRWVGTTETIEEAPFGIPCLIRITNPPPLLFEVSSLENAFQSGGHPWHYIPRRKKQRGVFHICALKDNSLAKNEIQEMEHCSLESDWIYFHADASGRIIHVGPNQVKVLNLTEIENNSSQHQISEVFVILTNGEKNKNENLFTVTSGLMVKKKIFFFHLLDDDPEQESFKIVDYEGELDLLSVVAVTQIDAEEKAPLDLQCNEYGTFLKSIPLAESWDVTHGYKAYSDRDAVLHTEQKPNRVFRCYVYQI